MKELTGTAAANGRKVTRVEALKAVETILAYLGENINREGLLETPHRYIKFLEEFTRPPAIKFTTFSPEGYTGIVLEKDIPFFSLCEHHLAPFFGVAHVAYMPGREIVGLSKLARAVEMFSRGFQNQERITGQVAEFLNKNLHPEGVAVQLEAVHLCMSMRGVKKQGAKTITQVFTGGFENPDKQRHFIQLVEGK
ncbi:MAG: GTP cyclohydrolase I [Sinomicrobium sp.]|nr:GTP cyclohydrolase I [Sinomicrobium sp.]